MILRRLNLYLVLPVLILVSACGNSESRSKGVVELSHAQLLTQPNRYDGYTVIVNGYAKVDGGFLNLYQTKEDILTYNKAASIWVDDAPGQIQAIEKSPCNNHYVTIRGVFGVIKSTKFPGIIKIQDIRFRDIEGKFDDKVNCF